MLRTFEIKLFKMKGFFIAGLLLSLTCLSAQTPDTSWSYTLNWAVPANSQDSIASLVIELTDVPNADSVETLWLRVTDGNNQIFQGDISVPPSCFSNAASTCSLAVAAVKSGFYYYEARLIYKDQTESSTQVIDEHNQLNE